MTEIDVYQGIDTFVLEDDNISFGENDEILNALGLFLFMAGLFCIYRALTVPFCLEEITSPIIEKNKNREQSQGLYEILENLAALLEKIPFVEEKTLREIQNETQIREQIFNESSILTLADIKQYLPSPVALACRQKQEILSASLNTALLPALADIQQYLPSPVALAC